VQASPRWGEGKDTPSEFLSSVDSFLTRCRYTSSASELAYKNCWFWKIFVSISTPQKLSSTKCSQICGIRKHFLCGWGWNNRVYAVML